RPAGPSRPSPAPRPPGADVAVPGVPGRGRPAVVLLYELGAPRWAATRWLPGMRPAARPRGGRPPPPTP
ncbi:sigma-70 family RNA polymerase sigma factor, partial [Streptomyces vinaceus]|nr:sigma-70 family RNA polymerase sigma factor [Streptomyces vinaceus]